MKIFSLPNPRPTPQGHESSAGGLELVLFLDTRQSPFLLAKITLKTHIIPGLVTVSLAEMPDRPILSSIPRSVPWLTPFQAWLTELLTPGSQEKPPVSVAWPDWTRILAWPRVSPFSQRVLRAVAGIPPGSWRSYGQIARELSPPTAARAVGRVMAQNPWPVLIPCHRVLAGGGVRRGYSAGLGPATQDLLWHLESPQESQAPWVDK